MKYIVQMEVDPTTGAEIEKNPQQLQEFMAKWQAQNPIAMYFSLVKRRVTIVLEAENEDSFFEALHATWVLGNSYPEVWPVVTGDEFGTIMQRLGMVQ